MIYGDLMTEQTNEEKGYNAEVDAPAMLAIAKQALPKSRAAVQRVARDALGLEPLFTDVEMQQNFQMALALQENTLAIMNKYAGLTKQFVAIVGGITLAFNGAFKIIEMLI